MFLRLLMLTSLVMVCLSQSSKQCYEFIDLTQNYQLKSATQDYPREAIVKEYGMRQELQELLNNILEPIPTEPSMTVPGSTARAPIDRRVLMTPQPKVFFDPKNIPMPFAGANPNGRINPYLKNAIPFQRPLAPNTFQQRSQNNPAMPLRPLNPLVNGPIPTRIPVTPRAQAGVIPFAQLQAPKAAPTPMYAGHQVPNLARFGFPGARRNLPLGYPRRAPVPPGRLAPVVPQQSKFTIEQLRQMAMPYKRSYQRYGGYNPYARSYRYGRQSGHFIRKRAADRISPKYTYKQLLQLANPFNRYGGAARYSNQGYRPPRRVGYYSPGSTRAQNYLSYNGYNPYRNNFNPYTARRYTNLRTRLPIGTRFRPVNQFPVRPQYSQSSRRFQYGQPQYRTRRSIRINPSEDNQIKPISESCPTTMMSIQQFTGLGGNCWVLEPEKQMVDYAVCGHDDCSNCKSEDEDDKMSKCVENYHWTPVWSYCDVLPQGKKIQEVELYLPKSCSCKTFQC
ncbi:hypothetical protein LOTGIDRAFT_231022 [Lottia gigantea]|uniref:Spaetzle domain-containing protein n=1 Tax=Lottia gigantea TaxID=225164 RepID=V4CDU1_LOTGI|nr:hypothetical protein LOTGIDRAFT_231022 [Lottia gigantea]ESP00115.1 hypothetical protein LOTGIDRAFT_231022 [Lottia gigantea]